MTSPRAPWVLLGVSLLAMLAALGMWAALVDDPFTPDIALFPIAYLAFAAVGAVILSRHPSNRIGRLAMAVGLGGSIVGVFDSYARAADDLPGQPWAAFLASIGFPLTLLPILLLVLVFPTGRVPSRRWRVVAGVLVAGTVIVAVGNAFTPAFSDYRQPNPLGVPALTGSAIEQGGVGWLLVVGAAVVIAGGLAPRLRRATGLERQQLKWITFAATVHGASWILLALDLPGPAGEAAQPVLFATLVLIPLAAGVAILRYRLYDIDVVIRRTVVYGAVVAVLAVLYASLVLGLQSGLSGVTGNETLPVALSTLATAALFGPVRARVRQTVDRRFFRSRYDAQRTLEGFATRLRDEVELDAVGRSLTTVAGEAVRPRSAAVWLRSRPS
jgi:hypothetical protein